MTFALTFIVLTLYLPEILNSTLAGGSESVDRYGCAVLALDLVPKYLIFAYKICPQTFVTRFKQGKQKSITIFASHEWFSGPFLNF